MHGAGPGIVYRYRRAGVIDEHLLPGAMLLPQHQVELLEPPPVQLAKAAVTIALRIALTLLLPHQLQCQVLVRLKIPLDCRPIRLPMFAPNRRRGSLGKQFLLDLRVVPILRQGPWHARPLPGGYVLMDGALRNRTTAGDLMLAQPEGMEPQDFFQFAHGQPLLW